MKRMKALLGVVLVIAMVLSLSITAFAAGEKIYVLDPPDSEYHVYRLFTVTGSGNALKYKVTDAQKTYLMAHVDETGLLVNDDNEIVKTDRYDPDKFATFAAANLAAIGAIEVTDPTNGADAAAMTAGIDVSNTSTAGPGYYLITYDDGTPYALTTITSGHSSSVEKKNDMPFEKTVSGGNNTSVEAGEELTYTITGKVPSAAQLDNYDVYNWRVWDKLSDGQVFTSTGFTVTIDGDTVDLLTITDDLDDPIETTPVGAVWFTHSPDNRPDDGKPTFVVHLNLKGMEAKAGKDIVITYKATVTDGVGVIENTAHLVSEDYIRDAQTRNYISKIVIDKYENGNAYQKLEGAEFVLYKVVSGNNKYYKVTETLNNNGTDTDDTDDYYTYDVDWVDSIDDATKVTTDAQGAAYFYGLEDGTYFLKETKAPDGFVLLDHDVEIEVNGYGALDPKNIVAGNTTKTEENQEYYLTNVSHVGNTPGTLLPSTGGRGTTMLYMAGLAMMLAAGAFLIFRRRAEAGK